MKRYLQQIRNILLFLIFIASFHDSVGQDEEVECVRYASNPISTTPVSCRGGSDGTITVQVIPGTSGVHAFLLRRYVIVRNSDGTYTGYYVNVELSTATSATSYTFRGLIASSTYDVVLLDSDDQNCEASGSNFIIVSQPSSSLRVTLNSKTDVTTCFGDQTGAIDINVSGATPPYSYSWSNGVSTQDLTNIGAGDYTVTVTDANGCTRSLTTTITQPSQISLTNSQTNPSCNGSADGTATVSASGGTGPYTYSWNTSPVQNSSTATGLRTGSYTVTVTDARGCVSTSAVTLAEPETLNASFMSTDACTGGNSGSIDLTVTGGTAPYSFAWTGGLPAQEDQLGVAAGTYNVTITDSQGCTTSINNIIVYPQATATLTGSNSICEGQSTNLTITLTGTAPWQITYLQDGANPITINNISTSSYAINVNPSATATYTLQEVQDANCTAGGAVSGTATVTVNPIPAAPVASNNGPVCQGSSVQLTASDVTGATYAWTGPNGYTSGVQNPVLSNVTAAMTGTYAVTVTVNGCTSSAATTSVTVHPISASPTVTSPVAYCQGATPLALTASGTNLLWYTQATGGTGSAIAPTPSTATIGSTSYYVSQTINNCESPRAQIIVTTNSVPATPTISGTLTFCTGSSTTLTSSATTGNQWLLNGSPIAGQTGQTLTVNQAGDYSIRVTNGNGCSATSTVSTITETPTPVAPVASNNGPACIGGSINLTASDVTGANYAWTGPNGFTSAQQNPVLNNVIAAMAGTYSVRVTVNGCTSSAATTTISVNPVPTAPTVSSPVSYCHGATAVVLTASGNSLLWYTQASGGTGSATAPTPSTATVGTTSYYVSQTVNGCESARAEIRVIINEIPDQPTVSGVLSFCSGSSTKLTSSAAVAYRWYRGTTPLAGQTSQTLTVSQGGDYTVVITDANGCNAESDIVTVTENAIPIVVASSNGTVCVGESITLQASTIANATYAWTGPNGFTSAQQNPVLSNVTASMAGSYAVTVTLNSCTSPAATTSVTVNPVPAAPTISGTLSFCTGSSTTLTSSAATGNQWLLNGNPIAGQTGQTLTVNQAGDYSVRITNRSNCSATSTASTVTETPTPTAPVASNNGPVCIGGTINLTASAVANATYSWTGPNGFTSAQQNPILNSVTAAMAGSYSVRVTVNGCTSTAVTTSVTVNPIPASPTVISPVAYCQGAPALALTASGTNLLWYTQASGGTGSATAPTPSTATVGTTAYYVSQTVNGCESARAQIRVIINEIPDQPTVSGVLSFCIGSSTTLTSSVSTGNQWYRGTTPLAGETRQTLTVSQTGDYSVVVTDANGCIAESVIATVTENPIPAAPVASNNGPVCQGGSITLQASAVANATYVWTGPNGFTSAQQNPVLNNVTLAMNGQSYQVTVTVNGCTSSIAGTTITVNPIPVAPTITSPAIYCQGATALALTANGNDLLWYTTAAGGTGDATAPIPSTATVGNTSYYVSQTVNGCESQRAEIVVTINPLPTTPTISGTLTYCQVGGSTILTSSATTGNQWRLNGNEIAGATGQTLTVNQAGAYSVGVTDANGCSATSAVSTVTETPTPAAPVASNNGPVCQGESITLTASDVTDATYAWSGPNGYTSTLQNPVLSNVTASMAGTYSVTVTVNSCTSSASNTDVVISPTPNASITAAGPFCISDNAVTLTAATAGGTWSGTGISDATSGTFDPATVGTGTHTITYTVMVNGCTATATASIVVNPLPTTPTISGTLSFCSGSTTTLTSSSTTGNQWLLNGNPIAGQTGQNLTVSQAGNYSVRVSNGNGCSTTSAASTVTEIVITADVTSTNPTRCSLVDGTITVSNVAGGGDGSYRYSIDGVDFSNTTGEFTGVAAGTYTISLRDGACTVAVGSQTLTAPNGVTADASTTNETACNASDGTITINVSTGLAPYSYYWNGSTTASASNQLTELVQGSYSVRVVAADNCEFTLTNITVGSDCTNPPVCNLTASASSTAVDCNAGSNGSITVSVSGGSGSYSYSIDGTTFQNSNLFTGLTANTYTVTVVDRADNTCSTTTSVTVTAPDAITATVTGTNPSSCATTDGTITVSNLAGGDGAYTYSIDNVTYQASATFDNLSNGAYTIYIRDGKGCSRSFTQSLSSADGFTTTVTSSPETACGANNGSIRVAPVENAEYYIDGQPNPAGETFNHFLGLAPGTYTITVVNTVTGCSFTASTTVTTNCTTPPTCSLTASVISQSNATCNGANDGSATISVSGGSGSYSYSIDGTTFQNNNIITGLAAGSYTVTIVDRADASCSTTVGVTITEPTAISADVTSTSPTICSSVDGTITVSNVGGGDGSYTYSINGVDFSNTTGEFTGVAAGTYTVSLRNGACATVVGSATLTAPSGVTATASTTNETACNASDGTITINVSTGLAPYSYYWNGSTTASASNQLTELVQGSYSVRVLAADNCEFTLTNIAVGTNCTNPPVCNITASITAQSNATCNGANDGSATVSVSGGTAPYSYSWNTTPVQTTASVTGLREGTYTVTITDASSCRTTATVTITEPVAITAPVASNSGAACVGGNIQLTASEVTGATYTWTGPNGFTSGVQNPVLTNLTASMAGTYSVRVTVNGCTSTTATTNVTVNPAPLAPTVTSPVTYCQGAPALALTASGTNLLWYTQATGGTGSTTSPTPSTATVASTSYYVSQTVNGCESTRAQIMVNVVAPAATPTVNGTLSFCQGGNTTLTSSAVNGNQWYRNGTIITGATGQNLQVSTVGSYTVVVNENGCAVSSDPVAVTERPSSDPSCGCTLTANYSITNVRCAGGNDGQALLFFVNGGSNNYEYRISPGVDGFQASPNFTELAAGDYLITVRDVVTACQTTVPISIATRFTVSAFVFINPPRSCGGKGSIEFTNVSGGTAPYQVSVDGTNFITYQAPSTSFTDLDPREYLISVKDNNNCALTERKTMAGLPAITARITPVPVSCHGGNDGRIVIANASGGANNGYVYSIDGTNYSGTTNITGVRAGNHTVFVKDANGTCIQSFPVTVTEPVKLALTLNNTQPGTCDGTNGAIGVSINGGTAGYQYKLDVAPYTNFQPTGGSNFTITGLRNGTYKLTIRDNNLCSIDSTITLVSPDAIRATVTPIGVTCNAGRDGRIAITNVTGGSGNYKYYLNDEEQTGTSFSNLTPGSYKVEVRDTQTGGCSATYSVVVNEADPVTATISVTNPTTCTAVDGAITITGGAGAYQFSLDSLNNFTAFKASHTFANLSNGMYKVYVKNGDGCYAVYSQRLASPNSVLVGNSVTITPPTCKGSNNGRIDVNPTGDNVTGGQPAYEYSIDGTTYQRSSAFPGLIARNYTVYIKDASDCIYTFNYTLSEPSGIEFEVVQLAAAGCGERTGSVKVQNIKGGKTPYSFSLNNVDFQSDSVFTGLIAGSYKMYVRDNSEQDFCQNVKPFNVSGASPISYNVQTEHIGCEGGNKGKLVIKDIAGGIATGGSTRYRISITGGEPFRELIGNTISFDSLAAGTYKVVIRYGSNFTCSTATRDVQIFSEGIPFTVLTTPATCGAPNGSAKAVIPNQIKPYFYSIDNVNFYQTPEFKNLKPGSYIMSIRERVDDPCMNQLAFIVGGADSLKYHLAKVDCFFLQLDSIRGGTPPYKISLDGGETFVSGSLFANSFTTQSLMTGNYKVVVEDNLGCRTIPQMLRIENKVEAKIKSTLSLRAEPTGEIQITDIRGGVPPYQVSLDGFNWGVVKDKTLPIDTVITGLPINYNMGKGDDYGYTVYIKDASGCMFIKNHIEIKESLFTIPNVFTPNNDGINDTFFIRNLPTNTYVTIANRWGKLVYSSKNYQNDWDGEGLVDGIYYFTVDIAGQGRYTGWVQIWR